MSRVIDIRALLERRVLGSFRRRAVALCLLIAVVDGFDVQAMAFVAPVLSGSWQISRPVMGQVLTAGLVGLLFGNVLLGRLSDRIGRRPVLLGSVVLFGVASLATALCENVPQLIGVRVLTGVGLGGAIVAALALTSEYAPTRARATLVTSMFVGFPVGGSIGGLLATSLIERYGWQGIFVLGGLMPLALVAAAWRYVPESLQFLSIARPENTGAIRDLVGKLDPEFAPAPGDRFVLAEDSPSSGRVAELVQHGRLPGTALLWLICFGNLLVLYLLANWLPSIVHQSGASLARANLAAVVFNIGGVVGGLALSQAVDRLGAFRVLTIAYAVGGVVILALPRTDDVSMAFVLTFLAGSGVIGTQFCVNALASGFYPTAVRSTGVGWALGFGRVGSIAGPLIGGIALGSGVSHTAIFSGVALPLLVCSAAVAGLSLVYARPEKLRPKGVPA